MIWDVEQEDDDYGICTCAYVGKVDTWFGDTCRDHKERDEEEHQGQVIS